ncbi:T9SS type A sorting domain-containing protein [Ferruginibacter sp.]
MKKIYTLLLPVLFVCLFSLLNSCGQKTESEENETEENDMYDGPDKAIEFEIERTKNPATGKVPWEKLRLAIEQTEQAKLFAPTSSSNLSWIERGPDGDISGPQGNSRPNNDQTAGRIRASIVDSLDPTHKTVWVGGIDGGLWKTTDITASPANWILINDFLSNLAVSAICQDPRPGFQNNMYFCTGESFSNADAVRGVGVFKSTNGGATWSFLPSTSSYLNGTRIICDFLGNVYLGTRGNGLLRSTDGGTTWTTITPSGLGTSVCDLEISSTSAAGRLHVTTGIFSAAGYNYTDIPATVTSASGWNAATTPFTTFNQRTEMAISGNVLYALPDNASHQVPTIWKSTDGGANWASTTGQPASGWASGQGWYSLSAGINPANSNECIVGGLDCHKTLDGGATWTKISTWVGFTGQYVHADQHNIQWWDGGSKLMFNCDGGVHYSSNGGTTITDRNKGLRIKQFYSIAIHPSSTNYFLTGAQDNGVHRLNHPGLDSSVEVYGGDGCYVAIDQNEPQFQFGSYVFNVYRRSTNNGASWTTPVNNQSTGRFVNPWDYDNNANIIYACNNAGTYLRWNNPQGPAAAFTEVVTASAFGTGNVSAAHASPYTANKVYFGLGNGVVVFIDNANTGTAVTGTVITPAGASGYANCVVTGSSDQNLMTCYSSYGVQNVWVSSNGGTSWTACDGNLPDMPVRWGLFHPDTDTKAFIATETGVWETDLLNGASTVWTPSTSFPNVRTDMIKYRSSDRTIAAGTHGRGIWSANIPSGCTSAGIATQPTNSIACVSNTASFSITGVGTGFQWQESINGGGTFTNITNGGIYSGATTTTLTLTGVTAPMNNYQYRCVVTGTCTPLTVTSNSGILTVNAATSISSQPASSSICANTNTSFTVAATGASLTYQWQISTNGGGTYISLTNTAPYSGVNTNTLAITAAPVTLNGNLYRCIIGSVCTPINSNAGTLTVNATPTITTQPVSNGVCAANSVTFTVAASGGGLTYQWQESTNGGGTFNNIPGAAASSYTFVATLVQNGYQYRCVVSGACAPAATSAAATLTVGSSLIINSQPVSSILCAGGNTTFNINVSGTVTYQWQESINGGASYTNITNAGIYSGSTTPTLTLTGIPATANNNLYRCVVSGNCPSINSNAATLTVNTAPAITTQPVSSSIICAAQNTSFTTAATGTSLTYQWQVSTDGGVTFGNLANGGVYSNVNTATLNITGATVALNTYKYLCLIGGTCAPTVTTSIATLTVYTPVSVSANPANTTLCENSNASFSVTAAGTAPTYQWQVSTDGGGSYTNVSNTSIYSGATTATLTLTGVTFSLNSNLFRCVVSGTAPCGTVNSGGGTLNVNAAPAKLTVTGGGAYCAGSGGAAVGLSNSATGINYQLQLGGVNNGTALPGNGAPLNFGNKTVAGIYTVLATNAATGCTQQMTGSVTVIINPLPTISLNVAPYKNIFPGLVTTLTATASSAANPITYAWFKNNALISNTSNTLPVNITSLGSYKVRVTDANGCVDSSQIITIADSANSKLFIYPSPNDGKFSIVYYNAGGTSSKQIITIYSSRGEKVYNKEFPVNQAYQLLTIDLTKASAGVYYIILSDAAGNKIKTGEVLIR